MVNDDELFSKIDESMENVNYDENRDKSFRRYSYTWNHPFFDIEYFTEVDIENTNLTLDLTHYDLHNLKSEFNKDFFDFKYIEYEDYKTGEKKVIERPFFKNTNCIRDYVCGFSTMRYSMFQIEKGGNCETTHIQGFITFKNPMTWSTFKNNFPCSHFNKCLSTNLDCRRYCSKEDTRVEGPFEDGTFVEERSRSGASKEFLNMVNMGASDEDLMESFPDMYLREFNKLEEIRLKRVFEPFKYKYRQLEVVYIYGPPRCGKTSYVVNEVGYGNFYNVDTYKYGPFDKYSGENVIVFDEYDSQIGLTTFNKLLDGHPVQMPCRFKNRWACYQKVYIISNMSLFKQYDSDGIKSDVLNAFHCRIHKVIRFNSKGEMFIEKDITQGIDNIYKTKEEDTSPVLEPINDPAIVQEILDIFE